MVNIQKLSLLVLVLSLLWLVFAFSYSTYVIQVIKFRDSTEIDFSQGIRIHNSGYWNQVFDTRNIFKMDISKSENEANKTDSEDNSELSKTEFEDTDYAEELSEAEIGANSEEIGDNVNEPELSNFESEDNTYEEKLSKAEIKANITEMEYNMYEEGLPKAEIETNTTEIGINVFEPEITNFESENNTYDEKLSKAEIEDNETDIENNVNEPELSTAEMKVNINEKELKDFEEDKRVEELTTAEIEINKSEEGLSKSEIKETKYEVEVSKSRNEDKYSVELSKSEIEERKEWIKHAKFTLFMRQKRNNELLEYIQSNFDSSSGPETGIGSVDRYFSVRDRRVNPHEYRFVYTGQKICGTKTHPWLLIMVLSVANKISQRSAIRQTWGSVAQDKAWPGKKQYEGVKIMFIFGKTDNAKDNAILWRENEKFGDIVQADFIDSYNNLTTKVMMGIKWTTKFCPGVSFLLKVDDDSFIHVPNAIKTLKRTRVPSNGAVYGNALKHPTVLRESKWGLSRNVYPFQTYPIYTNGQAYAISGNILQKIFTTGEYLPYVFIEDAFITGIVRTVIGASVIPLIGFPSAFMKSAKPCEFHNNIRVAATNISPHLMKAIWGSLYSGSVQDCYKCLRESC